MCDTLPIYQSVEGLPGTNSHSFCFNSGPGTEQAGNSPPRRASHGDSLDLLGKPSDRNELRVTQAATSVLHPPECGEEPVRCQTECRLHAIVEAPTITEGRDALAWPLASNPPLRVVPPGGNAPAPKSLRILIADDHRDTAHMLGLVLRNEGHDVQISLRGDEALEACRLFRPDVVIADVNMPGTSGYGLARALRERHRNLAPLLIAITGVWTTPTDRMLATAVGFDHYLLKPCDPEEILRLIEPFRGVQSADGASSSGYQESRTIPVRPR